MKRLMSLVITFTLFALMVPSVSAASNGSLVVDVDTTTVATSATSIINGVPYVTFAAVLPLLSDFCEITEENNTAAIIGSLNSKAAYAIKASKGQSYVNVNGRYFYIPTLVQLIDGKVAVPLSVVAKIVGGVVTKEGRTPSHYVIYGGSVTPMLGSKFYNSNVVDVMARTILSEAGNQSMRGKIAVGNVIYNRVWSPNFPNTVSQVVLEKNQFSGTETHWFFETPPESCVIAAKIALEGTQVLDHPLYFNVTGMDSWAFRNRPFLATIGGHDFFG